MTGVGTMGGGSEAEGQSLLIGFISAYRASWKCCNRSSLMSGARRGHTRTVVDSRWSITCVTCMATGGEVGRMPRG